MYYTAALLSCQRYPKRLWTVGNDIILFGIKLQLFRYFRGLVQTKQRRPKSRLSATSIPSLLQLKREREMLHTIAEIHRVRHGWRRMNAACADGPPLFWWIRNLAHFDNKETPIFQSVPFLVYIQEVHWFKEILSPEKKKKIGAHLPT